MNSTTKIALAGIIVIFARSIQCSKDLLSTNSAKLFSTVWTFKKTVKNQTPKLNPLTLSSSKVLKPIWYGDRERLTFLLASRFFDVNHIRLEYGIATTPLAETVFWTTTSLLSSKDKKNFDTMQFFIDQGADVNQPSGNLWNMPPLHLACWYPFGLPTVKFLIKNGADAKLFIKGSRFDGTGTPREIAFKHGNMDIVEYLDSLS